MWGLLNSMFLSNHQVLYCLCTFFCNCFFSPIIACNWCMTRKFILFVNLWNCKIKTAWLVHNIIILIAPSTTIHECVFILLQIKLSMMMKLKQSRLKMFQVCVQDFCEELEYWGLTDLHLEPCCQHTYYRARWLLPSYGIQVGC